MNKVKLIEIINDIFGYIDNGKDISYNTGLVGHPALYVWHSKEELNNEMNRIIENKNDYDKYDVYYYAQQLIKYMIGKYDSHTSLHFIDSYTLPIEVKFIDDKLYIINSNNEIFIGSYINSINGIDIKLVINELEKTISYANIDYLKLTIEYDILNTSILCSLPVLKNATTFEIETNKGIISFDINKKEELKTYDKKENYTIEKNGNTTIITYNFCRDEEKMAELIKKLNDNICDNYIIDIRGNPGGNSSIALPLINFLTDKNVVVISDEKVFSSARMFLISMKNIGAYLIGKSPATPISCFGNNVISKKYTDLNLRLNVAANYWYYDKNLCCTGISKKDFLDKFTKIKELMDYKYVDIDYECSLKLEDYINKTDSVLKTSLEIINNKQVNKHF